MHAVIERELEDYLGGSASREFESHLAQCATCRAEVGRMRQVSVLLSALRAEQPPTPSLAFSSRFMRNIQERRRRSFWGILTADPAFTQKLALASILSLAVLGGYFATQGGDAIAKAEHTPEAVMASHDTSPAASEQQHIDGMLMTLATYHQ